MPYYLGMNIKTKRNLHHWDFPNIQKVEINNVLQDIPELTEENFWTLLDDYNKLIKCFNDSVEILNKEIKDLKSR
tara:strand:- start:244 stop:468 length:225 start_codon:yes stop_codon:yes gene_type:complete